MLVALPSKYTAVNSLRALLAILLDGDRWTKPSTALSLRKLITFLIFLDCWDVYATPLKQVMLVYVNGCTAQCFDPLLNRVHNPKVPEDPDPPP